MLACPNCRHPLPHPAPEACPECGARRPITDADAARLATLNSSLSILSWCAPLALLAWASPQIASAGGDSRRNFITSSIWFLLLVAIFAYTGIRRLERCLNQDESLTRPLGIAVISLLVLEASGLEDQVYAFLNLFALSDFGRSSQFVDGASTLVFAAWTIPVSRVLAGAARLHGLERIAARLLRWTWPLAISIGACDVAWNLGDLPLSRLTSLSAG